MAARSSILIVLAGALVSLAAEIRTRNFIVEAPTEAIARRAGEWAEYYRREKAIQWLGREMPPWNEPCPLKMTLTMNGSGGATNFQFDHGQIFSQDMHIEGSLDRMIASVMPHEITHTVFAHYFRQPVPRWADEGGAVLSEDDLERGRHDKLVREILQTPGRAFPLRRLFGMTQYPRDVMVLYAEGYSVTNYLVGLNGKPAFLQFIAAGMQGDWDSAVRAHYRFDSIEQLERAWVESLKKPRPDPATLLVSRPNTGDDVARVTVRTTVPPVQPILEAPQPIVRGQAPEGDGDRRPSYLPEFPAKAPAAAKAAGGPLNLPPSPGMVKLGAPIDINSQPPPSAPAPAAPTLGSPVGYSR
jgi:hypothetical protein